MLAARGAAAFARASEPGAVPLWFSAGFLGCSATRMLLSVSGLGVLVLVLVLVLVVVHVIESRSLVAWRGPVLVPGACSGLMVGSLCLAF